MSDLADPHFPGREELLDSAPDIWLRLKKSLARQVAEALISELSGEPSNHTKLIYEEIVNTPWIRKAA